MENPRTRDCIILFKGDCFTVAVDDALAAAGWQGGQAVKWAPSLKDLPTVTLSDGFYAGFALWGSNETADQFTAMTGQFPAYRFAVIGSGGWLIMTQSFERYTYASRTGGGPLVEIDYHASDRLLFSLRGYWSKEDEWSLAGDPRAPNTYYIGYISQAPNDANGHFMTIQTSI